MGVSSLPALEMAPFVSGVTVWHADRCICTVDPHLRHVLGISVTHGLNDCTAEAYAQRIHPDDVQAAVHLAFNCRDKGVPYITSYRLLDRNGAVLPIRQNGWWICTDGGHPTSLVSTITVDRRVSPFDNEPPFAAAIDLSMQIQRIAVDQGWRDVEYMASVTRSAVARIERDHRLSGRLC